MPNWQTEQLSGFLRSERLADGEIISERRVELRWWEIRFDDEFLSEDELPCVSA
jgi:hypothetical protein